ncbi:MAG: 2-oxoglutarate dehydrogenase E1 component [Myxococcota bacterium]
MPDFGVNQGLVEELFLRYCANPGSVPEEWRSYFDALPLEDQPELTSAGSIAAVDAGPNGGNGHAGGDPSLRPSAFLPPTAEIVPFVDRRREDLGEEARGRTSFPPSSELLRANELQGRVSALVNAFRVRGHLFANLDPLGISQPPPEELFLERYGLDRVDLNTVFSTGDMAGPRTLPLGEILDRLKETYCRSIGVEFTFVEGTEQRTWLQREMELSCNRIEMSESEQIHLLTKLTDAEIFEEFLHKNYVGAKRFSLEGAESFIPLLDLLVERSAAGGVEEVVIGMAHRGRLNVLANIMEKKLHQIFAGFEDDDPESMIGRGDVKYHLGYSVDRTTSDGRKVHLTLTFNPSHLEFVAPVVEGRVRAKQARTDEPGAVLPLVVHGDAAFSGQGIVSETLNLAGLEGYETDGTIHVVINNQVGFTTLPSDSRTTRYCTDITRMLRCPVFHVNGEDPEAVAQVVKLATDFRQKFKRDVVIDLYCYRKYGHNEGDEPRFTQPLMYAAVDAKRTVREVYIEQLLSGGHVTKDRAESIREKRQVELETALQQTRSGNGSYGTGVSSMQGLWARYQGGADTSVKKVETAVPRERLEELIRLTNTIPEGFEAHKKIARLYRQRIEFALADKAFDWGTAETLAYATLLAEGAPVRLSGQDSRRGTFSHRHAVIYDQRDGSSHCPLQHLSPDQGDFHVFDSPLSEAGVLGFEYGYSLDTPEALVIWEAQFGDFANGAQVIVDQFIMSSEDKWHRLSGLVMLLPHGFEGQGPEHSSARLERFLGGCAEDNVQVCNLTNAAQIFHVLRRQVVRPWRKPLIIMSPKSLLRHPKARVTLDQLANGGFQRIIPDAVVEPKKAKRVLICSGKVYYDLEHAREKRGADDTSIIRFEQLYPLDSEEIRQVFADYSEDADMVWVQEEPWNMGAWFFINARLPKFLGPRTLRCVSREPSASPATGSKAAHEIEQRELVDRAFSS